MRSSSLKYWLCSIVLMIGLAASGLLAGVNAQDTTTFTSEDGTFSFTYPAEWVEQSEPENNRVILATSQAVLDATASVSNGERKITVYLPNQSPLLPPEYQPGDTPAEGGPEAVLQAAIDTGLVPPLSGIRSLPLGDDREAVFGDFGADAERVGFLVFVDVSGGNYVTLEVLTSPDEVQSAKQSVISILSGMTYMPDGGMPVDGEGVPPLNGEETETPAPGPTSPDPDLPEYYQSGPGVFEGTLIFFYPSGWVIDDTPGQDQVIVANTTEAIDGDFTVEPGQILMTIAPFSLISSEAAATPTDAAEVYLGLINTENFQPGQITETTVNGRSGAVILLMGASEALEGTSLYTVFIADSGGELLVMATYTSANDLALAAEVSLAIAATLEYDPDLEPVVLVTPTDAPTATVAPAETEARPADGTPAITATPMPPGMEEDGATPGAPTATAVPVLQQPIVTDRVGLSYSNGTMTIYNPTDQPLYLGNFELVTPDGDRRFVSRDFGAFMREQFYPGRCIHIYLTSQPYSPPAFCSDALTRELVYTHGTEPNLFWVWWPEISGRTSFNVVQDGEVIGTCEIAAGECAVEVPLANIPYIQEWP